MSKQGNGGGVIRDLSKGGTFWRLGMRSGRSLVMGPDGYRAYETDLGRWTVGQDNRGGEWTSGSFGGRKWTIIRNRKGGT